MSTVFEHRPEESQYTLLIDGELKGYATYEQRGDVIALPSTVISPELRGSGLGSKLVQFALDDLRDNSTERIQPICPFVVEWIERNPEYQELLDR